MIYTLHTNNLLTVYSVDMQYVLSLSLASDDVLKCDVQAPKVSWKLWFHQAERLKEETRWKFFRLTMGINKLRP